VSALPQNLPKIRGLGLRSKVPLAVIGQPQSIRSSLFSSSFPLLIAIDRVAPSYQLLDLSLAIRPAVFFFPFADNLSFEAGALRTSSLDKCHPH
jgi:hypothetical protein